MRKMVIMSSLFLLTISSAYPAVSGKTVLRDLKHLSEIAYSLAICEGVFGSSSGSAVGSSAILNLFLDLFLDESCCLSSFFSSFFLSGASPDA